MLDFSNSKISPYYTLTDYRNGAYESVRYTNGAYLIEYKENKDEKTVLKSITAPSPVVVDGGFNYFVKQEWEKLMRGEIVLFNYISTARQDYYRFQLTIKKNNPSLQNEQVIVIMEPTNYILRALLDPIYITYNKKTKRIIEYSGISNIKDRNGETQVATLTYPTIGP